MDEEVRKKKVDFANPTFRRIMKENLKNECINCGSTVGIEYHHVVPLSLGGTNRLTNIVPVCHACHMAAHTGRHAMKYDKSRQMHTGRYYKTPYEDCIEAFEMYAGGEIGRKECEELLNMGRASKINDAPAFKKFKEQYCIVKMKNTRDLSANKNHGKIKRSARVCIIEFGDPDPGMYYVVGGQPITEIVRKRRRS